MEIINNLWNAGQGVQWAFGRLVRKVIVSINIAVYWVVRRRWFWSLSERWHFTTNLNGPRYFGKTFASVFLKTLSSWPMVGSSILGRWTGLRLAVSGKFRSMSPVVDQLIARKNLGLVHCIIWDRIVFSDVAFEPPTVSRFVFVAWQVYWICVQWFNFDEKALVSKTRRRLSFEIFHSDCLNFCYNICFYKGNLFEFQKFGKNDFFLFFGKISICIPPKLLNQWDFIGAPG